jgi:hypothetical protein
MEQREQHAEWRRHSLLPYQFMLLHSRCLQNMLLPLHALCLQVSLTPLQQLEPPQRSAHLQPAAALVQLPAPEQQQRSAGGHLDHSSSEATSAKPAAELQPARGAASADATPPAAAAGAAASTAVDDEYERQLLDNVEQARLVLWGSAGGTAFADEQGLGAADGDADQLLATLRANLQVSSLSMKLGLRVVGLVLG